MPLLNDSRHYICKVIGGLSVISFRDNFFNWTVSSLTTFSWDSPALTLKKKHNGQTSVYHPFPDSNAVWIYDQGTCLNPMSNPPCTQMDYHIYYYYLQGDTTVGANVYHKLYSVDSSAVVPNGNFILGIREDLNRKIFLTDFSTPEQLLYDFSSTNIGDTIVYSYNYYCKGVISAIDSIQLNSGQWRKRYQTNACDWPAQPSYIIEGIGSNYDLIRGPVGAEFAGWSLRCFHQDDSLVYIYDTSATASCYMNYAHVGIVEQKNKFSISISPNPFYSQTVLQTDNPLHNATLTVDNCFGQTVAQIKNISGQTIVFNRGNLANGLYFVRLTEENKTIAAGKLVVSDESNH